MNIETAKVLADIANAFDILRRVDLTTYFVFEVDFGEEEKEAEEFILVILPEVLFSRENKKIILAKNMRRIYPTFSLLNLAVAADCLQKALNIYQEGDTEIVSDDICECAEHVAGFLHGCIRRGGYLTKTERED